MFVSLQKDEKRGLFYKFMNDICLRFAEQNTVIDNMNVIYQSVLQSSDLGHIQRIEVVLDANHFRSFPRAFVLFSIDRPLRHSIARHRNPTIPADRCNA